MLTRCNLGKSFVVSMLSLVLLGPYVALAQDDCANISDHRGISGGLLLFNLSEGERWILLADYEGAERKWSGLGGKFDSEYDTYALDAAIREVTEESFCYITEAAFLSSPTDECPIRESEFVTYLVHIPRVKTARIEDRKVRRSYCWVRNTTKERKRFRWVDWSHLKRDIQALKNGGHLPAGKYVDERTLVATHSRLPGQGNYYRRVYANTLSIFLDSIMAGNYPGW